MSIQELLQYLDRKGIGLKVTDNNLKVNAPEDSLTPSIIADIKENKEEIIRFLNQYRSDGSTFTAISFAEEKDYYVLSSAQKRLYIIQQMEPDSTRYNMWAEFRIDRETNLDQLEAVFHKLIRRHESLRTSFLLVDDMPMQRIHPTEEIRFQLESWELPAGCENAYQAFCKPFDLSTAPLLRAGVARGADRVTLMVDVHHIVSDGLSQAIFEREFNVLLADGLLPPLGIQYKDYAQWQNSEVQQEVMKKQETFWLNLFSDELPVQEIPGDYPRPPIQSVDGRKLCFYIESQRTASIMDLALDTGSTLYIVLLSAFTIFLSKLTHEEDIIVGTPVAGRRHADLANIMGMFVNTLSMRNYPSGMKRFFDFLAEVNSNTLKAFDNQDYQFENLVEKVVAHRDMSRNPLFDVAFNFLNQADYRDAVYKAPVGKIEVIGDFKANFDIIFQGTEIDNMLYFTVDYCTAIYKEETIRRFIGYFESVLTGIIEEPSRSISSIPLLTLEEQRKILEEFNDTFTDYPRDKTIQELFEQEVEKKPACTALVYSRTGYGTGHLTYSELSLRSGNLALQLRQKGAGPGTIMALKVERSFEMITGILAILKSGGAYLPIAPDTPDERVEYMLKDSKAGMLLSSDDMMAARPPNSYPHPPTGNVGSDNIAYIIYTSGSTGKPKGTLVSHANVTRVVRKTNYIDITPADRILQLSNYAFDGSVFDIYGALLNGSKLVLVPREDVFSPVRLGSLIAREDITVFFVTTALFNTMIDLETDCFHRVRKVLFGGETVSVIHARKALEYMGKGRILHVYGPTETTVFATYYPIDTITSDANTIPIGKPIANTSVYILDRWLNPVPLMISGEVYIGGDGVCRGYLNNPELTAECFITFRSIRSYKTGDLARWLPNGNIEFLGRTDYQVKIRGFRIELGEIESRLLEHDRVFEAVVTARDDERGGKHLCAYFVGEAIDSNQLREFLSPKLPEYMVPSHFTQLTELPLNRNGKLDRKSFPAPDITAEIKYQAPRGRVEQTLVDIWTEALGLDRTAVGVNDNFFQLGGHSLKATAVANRIHRKMGLYIPLTEVFKYQTIAQLAGYIESQSVEANSYVALEPAEEREFYNLTSAQKRLFILQRMIPTGTRYNMWTVFPRERSSDLWKVEKAVLTLIRRHESFRTSFHMICDKPVQRIHPAEAVSFEVEEIELSPGEEVNYSSFCKPFDLSEAPLLRVAVVKTGGAADMLLVDMHHIISDGYSQTILEKEFNALLSGEELTALRIQYKDYAQWQNSAARQAVIKEQETFWLAEFNDEIPILDLPVDYQRPQVQSFEGRKLVFSFGRETTSKLCELSRQTGATVYMILLSAFNILLSKLSGQEDIVVGIPIAGRRHTDVETIIGMFVNTLAVRNYPESEKTFSNFLKDVKEHTIDVYENQDYPFEDLVDKVAPRRDLSRNPLFDVMFNFMNRNDNIEGVQITTTGEDDIEDLGEFRTRFDISFLGTETEGILCFTVDYCSGLFMDVTIRLMIGYFKTIVDSILQNPELRISAIRLLTEDEKKQILIDFNDTGREYPADKTLHQLFEEQAIKYDNRCSVVSGHSWITYGELDRRANQIAYLLREKGVESDTIVGLMVHPSLEMIIGILGILKTGGAFLPIDPNSPRERIDYMIKDSSAKILLTSDDLPAVVPAAGCPQPATGEIGSDNLAYVIYTSGTTGRSKGTLLEHRNLVNYSTWFSGMASLSVEDRSLLTSSFAFDLGYTAIFPALVSGCQLHIVPRNVYLAPEELLVYIRVNRIGYIKVTPSLFSTFVESPLFGSDVFKSLRFVVMGGENIKVKDVAEVLSIAPHLQIINHYGPTEATIGCVSRSIDFDEFQRYRQRPTIGSPIYNMKVSIIDKDTNLCPIGVAGELCVSGAGVARGYLNRPELTSEKFIHWVLNTQRLTLYRTGDRARWLRNGNIEFLGRNDNQVKIRGYRVELGEIENRLLGHTGVKESAVITRQDSSGRAYLCAYVVPGENRETLDPVVLKEHLTQELPDYMIPSFFITIDRIPLTPNGKLDRRLLPEPDTSTATVLYFPPRDDLEKTLVQLWQVLLSRESIGIDENFFSLGGNSLSAILLVSRVHKALEVKVSLAQMFKTPTIRGLSDHIRREERDLFSIIPEVEDKEYYPLSSAQQRLYILQQLDQTGTGYNMPRIVQLKGQVKLKEMENSFKKLVQRHESLRTSFHTADDNPVQIIHNDVNFSIDYLNIESKAERQEKKITEILSPGPYAPGTKGFIRPFDMTNAPLIRVGVIRLEEDQHIMILDSHHIIADGTSMGVFIEEFMSVYAGEELPELKLRYRDYVNWQQQPEYKRGLNVQEHYWLEELSGELPVLNLPIDFPRTAVQDFEGRTLHFELGAAETQALKNFALKQRTTLYMVVLAAVYVLLSKLCGQEDIIVGAPTAGRRHADLERVFGMFINTLALRQFPEGQKSFGRFLEEMTARTLSAFENQDFPLEELVEKVVVDRDSGRNPIFNVVFILQNMDMAEVEIPGLVLAPYPHERGISKFDLTVMCAEVDETLACSIEYGTALFKEDTILRFKGFLKHLIAMVPGSRDTKIADIELITDEEKERLLVGFNNTVTAYPFDKTIHRLFEEQVDKTPDTLALIGSEGESMTFDELNRRANRVARLLYRNGAVSNSIIALMLDRSLEMIWSILAILKAGCAYLPLEIQFPEARIKYMLRDSTAKLVVTREIFARNFDDEPVTVISCDEGREQLEVDENLENTNSSCDIAYVIYTSGTTGKPKGVLTPHRSAIRVVKETNYISICKNDRIMQWSNYAFDGSVFDIYGALLNGAHLVLASSEDVADIGRLAYLIKRQKVSVFFVTTALFNALVQLEIDSLKSVRQILFGGERVSPDHVRKALDRLGPGKIIHVYGPTETTVYATSYPVNGIEVETGNVPIGGPIANTVCYVFSNELKPQPIGVTGELYIGGDGVARGYLNRPELTLDRFVHLTIRRKNLTLYKTGDLCRWLSGGILEFMGRIDHQVKIRGFRIELGEIRHRLMDHELINEAEVIALDDKTGGKYLCAYIVTSEKTQDNTELQQFLAHLLPDYMVPTQFIQLEAIPLNKNGKIDRKALPVPDFSTGVDYVAPRDEVEKKLVKIWSQLVNIDWKKIGIDDGFFEIGGHSLKAATMMGIIHRELGVKIELLEIFKAPTIRKLAVIIQRTLLVAETIDVKSFDREIEEFVI